MGEGQAVPPYFSIQCHYDEEIQVIIVKGARNKDGQRSEDYAVMAVGEEDSYGNPFRLIRLRWRGTRYHRMNTYAKTRGFEDAVIEVKRNTGELVIRYRQSGSAMWARSKGGVGAFFAEVPKTQQNMARLARCYEDKLWTIVDTDIDGEVKAMSDRFWADMAKRDEEHKDEPGYQSEVAYNRERIRRMHILPAENLENIKAPVGHELEHEQAVVSETAKLNRKRDMDLARREAEIAERERKLMEHEAKIAGEFTPIGTGYSEESLGAMKMHEVRRVARDEFGLKVINEDKKAAIIEMIMEKQLLGNKTPAVREEEEDNPLSRLNPSPRSAPHEGAQEFGAFTEQQKQTETVTG